MQAVAKSRPGAEVVVPAVAFEQQAIEVASRLRAELAAVMGALPGPVGGGTDLHRQLGMGNTLSWQLHSFVTATNPAAALGLVPGRTSMTKLVQAAKRKGVADALLDGVTRAYDQFEVFSREHARDRATLNSLLSGLGGNGEASAADLARRRSAFRDNSHLWGVQAQTCLRCVIWHAGSEPGTQDGTLVSGYARAHPLRRGVNLHLSRLSGAGDSSETVGPTRDRMRPATDFGVLTEFSSRPTPELVNAKDPSGKKLVTKILAPGVGKGSAVDFFMWERVRNATQGVKQTNFSATCIVSLPVEVYVQDLLVPRGWADPASVSMATYANPANVEAAYERDEEDRLPVKDSAAYLGMDLGALGTPDVPRYSEMLHQVLGELGWGRTLFDIFRCRVRYPILHSVMHLRVEAPAPAEA